MVVLFTGSHYRWLRSSSSSSDAIYRRRNNNSTTDAHTTDGFVLLARHLTLFIDVETTTLRLTETVYSQVSVVCKGASTWNTSLSTSVKGRPHETQVCLRLCLSLAPTHARSQRTTPTCTITHIFSTDFTTYKITRGEPTKTAHRQNGPNEGRKRTTETKTAPINSFAARGYWKFEGKCPHC